MKPYWLINKVVIRSRYKNNRNKKFKRRLLRDIRIGTFRCVTSKWMFCVVRKLEAFYTENLLSLRAANRTYAKLANWRFFDPAKVTKTQIILINNRLTTTHIILSWNKQNVSVLRVICSGHLWHNSQNTQTMVNVSLRHLPWRVRTRTAFLLLYALKKHYLKCSYVFIKAKLSVNRRAVFIFS